VREGRWRTAEQVEELAWVVLRCLRLHHPWTTGRRAVYLWAATTSQWVAYSATTITGWSGNTSQVSRNTARSSSGCPMPSSDHVAVATAPPWDHPDDGQGWLGGHYPAR
jgi:hypothetical protein